MFLAKWIRVAMLIAGVFLLTAADKPPAKPPTVTVTKSDGTTIRGELTSADPRQIVIQPTAKPKETLPPVTLTWKEIKSVSNGTTQKKLLAEWKKEHPESLCESCKGELTVRCATCKGTAHDPASAVDCKTCKASLLIDCKKANCEQGKIPCPATCLKLTQGTWTKKADGLRWRKFSVGGGTADISEHHLGQILVPNSAGGAPELKDCPTCQKKGKIDDPACLGTGQVSCPECIARASAPACPDKCEKGMKPCGDCDSVGLKKS